MPTTLARMMTAHEALASYGLGQYARTWVRQRRPKGFPRGSGRRCYANAARLAVGGRGTYVEGYGDYIRHAWVVDDLGRVIETTPGWAKRPGEYVGVPFLTRWVEGLAAKNQEWWTVLHYATNVLRDGTPLAEVVDVKSLARFDGLLAAC